MRRLIRPVFGAAIILAACAFLPGCSSRPTSGKSGAAGNVLTYALQNKPTTLDPALVEDGDTIDMIQQIFESVVKWDENNQVVPNIAEKWDISPDGKVYTFHLKDNVFFHDPFKRKVTAQDFVYSLTRALSKDMRSSTAKSYLNDIVGAQEMLDGKATTLSGVKAVDDKTLQITLDAPRAYFLAKLTYPTAYVVCKEAIAKNEGKWGDQTMIGTGPFKLREYKPEYSVSLAANADYHGGKPLLDGIERPIRIDPLARQNAFENDQADYADVQRADLDRVEKDSKLSGEVKQFKRANIYYLALNQLAFEPFKNKKVRQAFAMAVDKDQLIKLALHGTAQKANGILPPGLPAFNSALTGLPYNPQKAQQLLAEAGFPGGKNFPKLVISYRQGYQFLADAVLALRDDLKRNLGIEAEARPMEWAQFLNERKNGTMPCFHLRWAADYIDPQDFLSMMLRTGAEENKVGYSNPEFDKLCDQADVEQDATKRAELYQKAEQIAVDDAPWVCLYNLPDIELHKSHVKGIRDSLMGHLPHVTTTVAH